MVTGKTDMEHFFRQADTVAALVPASDVFGFLARALRLPSDFAALVSRGPGRRAVISPGGEVSPDGAHEILFVRTSPLELSFTAEDLPTQDQYLCRGRVTLRVAAVPERAELDSLRSQLMGSNSQVRTEAVVRYMERALADTLRRFCAGYGVESLADGTQRDSAAATVREAAAAPCFEAGLALAGAVRVEFGCDALREVRAKAAQTAKRLGEHAAQQQLDAVLADAQARHMDQLTSTLNRLHTLSAESPQTDLPDLLRTFSEAERGRLYAALFEAQAVAAATKWLTVACGPHLLFFSPGSLEAPARKVTLEGPIGPLRSVQCAVLPDGEMRLLVGASRGVYELAIDGATAQITYEVDGAESVKGGFNAAALMGDEVFASHSELGLVHWKRSAPQRPTVLRPDLTRGKKAVRNIHAADGRVVLSVDDQVVAFQPGAEDSATTYLGSRSVITAALAAGSDVFAGNADGKVLHWADGATSCPVVLHGGSGRAAESLALMSAGGVPRLLYTDTTLAVFARVLGDTFVCRYEAGGQTLRRMDAAADLIVGTTDARDRLVVWRSNRPGLPIATINVARLTGHTVQDVTLVPLP